jgi:hypothetical protein
MITLIVEDEGAELTAPVRINVEFSPWLFRVIDAVPELLEAITRVVGVDEIVKFAVMLSVKLVRRTTFPLVALTVTT